jgi:uncharacterized protein (DUF4415 family)
MNITAQDEINALKNLPDDQIDTSDIPEITNWENVQIGRFYQPKNMITIQIDTDILSWLESQNYQNKINDILRNFMLQQLKL